MTEITLIQVFVSCPGDVSPEKTIVYEVCDRLNKILLKQNCRIQFAVRDWGEVFGEIGVHPQDSINATFNEYDIYIGILWMRFGTPTKNINPVTTKPYQSGTEEEFEIAFRKKEENPASVRINFFFKDPIATMEIVALQQLREVLTFKNRLMGMGMINPFINVSDFKDKIYDLLYEIGVQNCLEKRRLIKEQIFENQATLISGSVNYEKFKTEVSLSFKNFEHLNYYISRSLLKLGEENQSYKIFPERGSLNKLSDVLLQSNRIMILGNAGVGKSIELQHFAQDQNNPFISIYKRFNTYLDQDIEDFLPNGWNQIEEELIVLLFDGLDEIQPKYFNTAIRKLLSFSDKYPKIKIAITCRSNFYELPSESFSGTLTGFDCYFLQDIQNSEIIDYVNKVIHKDGTKFINEVYDAGFLDIAAKPFFLNILISYFVKYDNLKTNKAEIIKESITSRIKFDEIHFNTTIEIAKYRAGILHTLKRIALTMEMLGRNYITKEELLHVVVTESSYSSLKFYSAFGQKNDTDNMWSFEHNNIQEFLAASLMSESSFEKIKKLISFPPSYSRVKPSWVNTLSFITSIADVETVKSLTDWLIETEPEILVKFEKDRIEKSIRVGIAKQIFESYKIRNIWISSNKFTVSELTSFSDSEEMLQFLLQEMTNILNTSIVKLNALHILEYLNINSLSQLYFDKVKVALFDLLEEFKDNSDFLYNVLRSMAKLKINDKDSILKVLDKFGKRRNQYIRAGLYKLIIESDSLNDFVQVFIDGLEIAYESNEKTDRDSVSLGDESWLLKEGIEKINSIEGMKLLVSYFNDRTGYRGAGFYYKKEIFEAIVQNAIEAFKHDASLYALFYELFSTSGRLYDLQFANVLCDFFVKTNTRQKVFIDLWKDSELKTYEKDHLISIIIDNKTIDHFIAEFLDRNFTKEDVFNLHRILIWFKKDTQGEIEKLSFFETRIKEETTLILEKPKKIDYEALNNEKQQKNFDSLFVRSALVNELQRIFSEFDSDKLAFSDLWEIRRKNIEDIDDHFLPSALNILRDFTRNESSVDFETVKTWVLSEGFDYYQIDQIRNTLQNYKFLIVSDAQKSFIEEWCKKTSHLIDWKKIIIRKHNHEEAFSINTGAEVIWFFIENLQINIDHKYLLEYTLFIDSHRSLNNKSHDLIDKLEKLLSPKIVQGKVKENIQAGISTSFVWKSNTLFAIDNNLTEVFLKIFNDLKDETKSQYSRSEVLDAIFIKTKNIVALKDVIENIDNEYLRWKCVELLMPFSDEKEYLVEYLSKVLVDFKFTQSDKLSASKHLIEFGSVIGIEFYTNYLLETKDPSLDYHEINFFTKITSIEFLPYLMKLLYLAKLPAFQVDRFNSLESIIISSLTNLAVLSGENLEIVKNTLTTFIEKESENLRNLNFLYFNIDRMEYQYYSTKSKSYTIEEAIRLIESVGI